MSGPRRPGRGGRRSPGWSSGSARSTRPGRERDSATIGAYKSLSLQLLRARARSGRGAGPARAAPMRPEGAGPGRAGGARCRGGGRVLRPPGGGRGPSRLVNARERPAQSGRIARDPGDLPGSTRGSGSTSSRRRSTLSGAGGSPRRPRPAGWSVSASAREAERHVSEAKVDVLKARLAEIDERLEALNARARSGGSDELALEFARQDLGRAESVLDSVTRSLDRAEFEAGEPVARSRREYRARVPIVPEVDHRAEVMAAVPAAMFLMVLGLFTLVEARAGRVADPEDVPGRLRLRVLGVVPPLPRPRPARAIGRAARRSGRAATSTGSSRASTTSGWRSARPGRPGRP